MIDPTFRNISRFFVLSFKNGDNDPTRHSFNKYYITLVEIKGFNTFIDDKPFFDQPVKSKQEAFEELIEMSRKDDYTRGNFRFSTCHRIIYNNGTSKNIKIIERSKRF